MPRLATNPIAPFLGQRVPLRGPARLLFRSYAKAHDPGDPEKRLTTRHGDNFKINMASFLEWHIWAFGSFEAHFAELFQRLVGPGDRCIDVGANVGVHTIRLAKLVGPQGEVIAIEPDAELARRARSNLRLNLLSNVRMIQAAADRHGGCKVTLYRPDNLDSNKARASMLPHSYLTGSAAEVQTVTIDDVCPGPVVLIKIDVEGFEEAVVEGAVKTIARDQPAVIFEYAPNLLHGRDSPFEWFSEHGYELFGMRQQRNTITGRGGLALNRLRALPPAGGDILALPRAAAQRVSSLVRSQ